MASNIRMTMDDGRAEACDFALADDLYLFFKFRSPNSECEIGIAYDVFIDSGDWYVSEGHLDECDFRLIDYIIDKLHEEPEWFDFTTSVEDEVRRFNRC